MREKKFIKDPYKNCKAKDPSTCPYHSQYTPLTLGDRTWDDLFNRIDREVIQASKTIVLEDADRKYGRLGVYRDIQEKFFETLTSDEQYALHQYGDERGSLKITYALTKFERPLEEFYDDYTKKQIALLDDIFARQVPGEPKVTYRGMTQLPYADKIQQGGVITFKNFVSTSLSPRVALTFAENDTPVMLEIETASGVPAVRMLGEYEYLLPRDSKYKVLEVTENVTCVVPHGNSNVTTAGVTYLRLKHLDDS